jgi:hypothetical protein
MDVKRFFELIDSNYESVVSRLRTEERIEKYLVMFLNDENYKNLCSAINKSDVELPFKSCHTLKGIVLNLGFDELYKPVFDLTESLRAKQFNDELFEQVEKQYKVILDAYNQTK